MALLQLCAAAAIMCAAATVTAAMNGGPQLRVACDPGNDLFKLLPPRLGCTAPDATAAAAVAAARAGDTVLVLADGYPNTPTAVPPAVFAAAQAKRLRLFVEFPAALPGGLTIAPGIRAGNMTFERLVVTTDAFGAELPRHRLLYAHGAQWVAAGPYNSSGHGGGAEGIQPSLVSARVAGYDTAAFGLAGAQPSPILFDCPGPGYAAAGGGGALLTVTTTKLSDFVRGRFAPVAGWQALWRALLGKLLPWAGPISLSWEAAVHPAYTKTEPLPAGAAAQASMTGVEWLRGRSGMLPGPRQLARISELLDPRWVDHSALSNCSYGECKARPWQPAGGERGDGRGGVLEGYTNLIQADGAQYQVLQFRGDCTCESAMAFASYAHTRPLAVGGDGGGEEEGLDDTDAVAGRLLDHAFSTGGLQAPAAINGALANGAMGQMLWSMGGSSPDGTVLLWGDDNARALLGAMTTASLLDSTRWAVQIARGILGNLRMIGVDGFRPMELVVGTVTGHDTLTCRGRCNISGWQEMHAANWSEVKSCPAWCSDPATNPGCPPDGFRTPAGLGCEWVDWAFSPHELAYQWALMLRAHALTGDASYFDRPYSAIRTMMAAYPGWAPISNGVQLQKVRPIDCSHACSCLSMPSTANR